MESPKRAFPVVRPVIVGNVRYEVARRALDHGFAQSNGVIAAVDETTGDILWMAQLYANVYDSLEERDCQETHVRALALDPSGHALLATDGRRRVWSLDLATREVTQQA